MDYGKVLSRALEITWKHRPLWLFGFLYALFGGGNTRLNYNLEETDVQRLTQRSSDLIRVPQTPEAWSEMAPVLMLILIPLVIIMAIVAVVVSNLAQAALIGMVTEIEEKEETSIKNGFRTGWSRWLVLFGISLVVGIGGFFYVLITGGICSLPAIMAFVGKSETLGIILAIAGLLFFLLLLLPFIPVSIIVKLAFRQAVTRSEGVFSSLGYGYRLFRTHLGQVIAFWLIMLSVSIGIAIVFGMISLFLVTPMVLSSFVNIWLTIALAIPVLIVTTFLGGLVQVFTSSAWTLAWQELVKERTDTATITGSTGFPAS